MALAVDFIDKHDLSDKMCRQLQPRKTKLRVYLYSSKRRYTHRSLLTRQSALVSK